MHHFFDKIEFEQKPRKYVYKSIYLDLDLTLEEEKEKCLKRLVEISKMLTRKLQKRFIQLPALLNFKCFNIATLQKLKPQHIDNCGQTMLKNLIAHLNQNYKKVKELKDRLFNEQTLLQEYKKLKTMTSTEWSNLETQEIYDKINTSANFMNLNKLIKMYRCLPLSSVE